MAGLVRTARARSPRSDFEIEPDARWLTLRARGGEFYFLRTDGRELRRGEDFADAVPLQAGFVDAMARIGALASGKS